MENVAVGFGDLHEVIFVDIRAVACRIDAQARLVLVGQGPMVDRQSHGALDERERPKLYVDHTVCTGPSPTDQTTRRDTCRRPRRRVARSCVSNRAHGGRRRTAEGSCAPLRRGFSFASLREAVSGQQLSMVSKGQAWGWAATSPKSLHGHRVGQQALAGSNHAAPSAVRGEACRFRKLALDTHREGQGRQSLGIVRLGDGLELGPVRHPQPRLEVVEEGGRPAGIQGGIVVGERRIQAAGGRIGGRLGKLCGDLGRRLG